MTSVHNVKRVKRNRLGIIPGKSGEHRIRIFKNPDILAVCVICGKKWWTVYNNARCCSTKCRNTFYYKRFKKKVIEQVKGYYQKHREEIIKYKHSPHSKALRHKREKWENYSQDKIQRLKKSNKKYQVFHLNMFRKGNKKWYRKNREYCLEYSKQRYIIKLLE